MVIHARLLVQKQGGKLIKTNWELDCELLMFCVFILQDCEDHAVLLCSLLLGFGLDAYVCVGTKAKGAAHTWVMVINTDGLVTFWESLTGHRCDKLIYNFICECCSDLVNQTSLTFFCVLFRYMHQTIDPNQPPSVPHVKPQYPYKTVGCVFNHECFFANCQVSFIAY